MKTNTVSIDHRRAPALAAFAVACSLATAACSGAHSAEGGDTTQNSARLLPNAGVASDPNQSANGDAPSHGSDGPMSATTRPSKVLNTAEDVYIKLRPGAVQARYEGALCPESSLSVSAQDPPALRLDFNGAEWTSHDDAEQVDCKGTASFQMAPGYGFSNPFVCFEAFGQGNGDNIEGAPVGEVTFQIGFTGGTSKTVTRKVIPDGRGLAQECVRLDVATACTESGPTEMTFSVTASASPNAFLRFSFLSIDMGYEHSAKWRTCDGSTVFAPSGPYGYCGGLNERGCESSLSCYRNERWNGEVDDGFCTGPDFQPALHGERCGGPKHVMCVAGSSCLLFEPWDGAPGICLSPGESLDCRQHGPDFCPEGYTCPADADGNCVRSDGKLDSTCADDSACKDRLVCDPVEHQCKPRRAQSNEPCGADTGVSCASNLTCDEQQHVCRESRGGYRDYCDETTPTCEAPFECRSHRCLKTNLMSGDVCSADEECAGIPLCTDGKCS